MNKLKNNDLIKGRKIRNVFRFTDDLISINDGWEFASKYCNIYHGESELGKGSVDKHEATFVDLNI